MDTAVAQAVEELQAAALLKANAGNWCAICIETYPHATAAAARAHMHTRSGGSAGSLTEHDARAGIATACLLACSRDTGARSG